MLVVMSECDFLSELA